MSCSGCVPFYQENQQAHMGKGGCLLDMEEEENVEMFCQPVNLESTFDAMVQSDSSSNYSEFESSSIGVECCICYETIGKTNNCVTECGHAFCLKCLVSAMSYNSACPYCRTDLIEKNEADDIEEGDDEEDVDNDEEEDAEDEDLYNYEDEDEYNDEDEIKRGNLEELTRQLEQKGFNMLDMVSVLVGKFSNDEKYSLEYINKLYKDINQINEDVEIEIKEQETMALEDVRA